MAQRGRKKTPDSPRSRSKSVGSEVVLPRTNLAGKAKIKGPSGSKSRGDTLNRDSRYQTGNQASNTARNKQNTNDIIRELSQKDGIFAAAVNSMVTLAVGEGFKVGGYDAYGNMSLEVMAAGYAVLDSIDTLHDYSQGYNDKQGMRSIINSMVLDTVTSGGCGCELVLDPRFGPERLVPISYNSIKWVIKDNDGGRYPQQDGNDNNLDLPTIFIEEHMKHPGSDYAESMMRPGIEMTFQHAEYIEDMRRVLKQTGQSRMLAKLDAAKVAQTIPKNIKGDPDKEQQFMRQQLMNVVNMLSALEPEDAAVFYDTLDIQISENDGEKADYATLLKTLSNMVGVAVKTPSSGIGLRSDGGQGLSNAETLVYMRTASAIAYPVCSALSRALTLAIRLMGVNGSIKLRPNDVDLRPKTELEAYAATRQKRILYLLSIGMINDAQACYDLNIRPSDYFNILSGTGFMDKGSSDSDMDPDRTGSAERNLNPGTPSKSGGEDQ